MTSPSVDHVSDTAFLTAYARAKETQRRKPLFRDPLAMKLLGDRGRALGEGLKGGANVLWTIAIRTVLIDELITRAIKDGVDTVLNLGAGLDTRPYRMALPKNLQWVEIDYPHVMAFKEERLHGETPVCTLKRIPLDLAQVEQRRRVLRELQSTSKQMLVVAEGVLPYLSVEDGASLADDVRAMESARGWIVDYISPQVIAFRRRASAGREMENAPLLFDPPDWFAFFLQHGWKAAQVRGLGEQAAALGRPMPLPLWMRLVNRVRSLGRKKAPPGGLPFAAYVLLEPTTPSDVKAPNL